MEFITLNNGVKMPAEGIGTFLLTPDKAETAVLSALKDGARLIDTANAYCNEKAVGRAMKKSGLLREEIVLETKLWPTFYTDADAVDKTLQMTSICTFPKKDNIISWVTVSMSKCKRGSVSAISARAFNRASLCSGFCGSTVVRSNGMGLSIRVL